MPKPPQTSTREEREEREEEERWRDGERMVRAAEMGPMAFATSLAPWANDMKQAERTCRERSEEWHDKKAW